MEYVIRRADSLAGPAAEWDTVPWSQAETLQVTHYPWPDSGHHPPTSARLLYDDAALAVIFRVEDRYVRAVAQKYQDSVCRDSCVEFFVAPLPDSDAYFNFEVNCGGTMLLHRCASSAERAAGTETYDVPEEDARTIDMAHSLPRIVEPEIGAPTTWTVEYRVPFGLFTQHFGTPAPSSGTTWRANFYKCGDATSHPHWGSWAPVGGPRPAFHQPASFQPICFA